MNFGFRQVILIKMDLYFDNIKRITNIMPNQIISVLGRIKTIENNRKRYFQIGVFTI